MCHPYIESATALLLLHDWEGNTGKYFVQDRIDQTDDTKVENGIFPHIA